MIKKIFPFLLVLFALTACGQTNGKEVNNTEDDVIQMIDVTLTAPENVAAGEPAVFQVLVTQAGKKVDNATVAFEFWKTGAKADSVKIEAETTDDGIYAVEHTLEKSGEFHVQSHVTANSMHVMPKKTFTVTAD